MFLLRFFTLFSIGTCFPIKSQPAYLQVDFSLRTQEKPVSHLGVNRKTASGDAGIVMRLENQFKAYIASVAVGTPEQVVEVALDTGLLDLWVASEFFDASKSSTYKNLSMPFEIGYADQTGACGYWSEETLIFGGVEVPQLRFGYAEKENVGQGVLGIGLRELEISMWDSPPLMYDNFPFRLVKEGKIPKAAYSLYLNSSSSQRGSVLFGAVDTAKYVGELTLMPLAQAAPSILDPEPLPGFYVRIKSILSPKFSYTPKRVGDDIGLLDTGASLIYAPLDFAVRIGSAYGIFNKFVGGFITECNKTGSPISFEFETATIEVPFQDILYPLPEPARTLLPNQCFIGVTPTAKGGFSLGDNFLRSAYVVYDLEDQRIGLAQVRHTDESNIVSIVDF